jgi:hypothetical protein
MSKFMEARCRGCYESCIGIAAATYRIMTDYPRCGLNSGLFIRQRLKPKQPALKTHLALVALLLTAPIARSGNRATG